MKQNVIKRTDNLNMIERNPYSEDDTLWALCEYKEDICQLLEKLTYRYDAMCKQYAATGEIHCAAVNYGLDLIACDIEDYAERLKKILKANE